MKLTSSQKIVLNTLVESKISKKFYWTGGTLLSIYYLHHRLSQDLDFFSEKPFFYEDLTPFINLAKKRFNLKEIPSHKIHDRWQFIIGQREKVKIEFVYFNHEKKRLKPLKTYLGVFIDSLEDIAANKTLAYFDRNEPKDLFDLYFIIKQAKFTAPQLLKLVKEKFGITFSEFAFWSESTKSLQLLSTINPLIEVQNKTELLKDIDEFFLKKGKSFLESNLK